LAFADAAKPSTQPERVTVRLVRHGPSLTQSQLLVSLVAVSAASPDLARLKMVQPSEAAEALEVCLSGGPAIAPLPTDPIERARAITVLEPEKPVDEVDAAVVIATSGSTGSPKSVVLSRAAIRASVEATHARLGGVGDWVLALPPCYIAGLMVLARAGLGRTRAVPARSDLGDLPEAAGKLSERRYISLVPAQLDRALHRADVTEALASFSAVLVGGAPASADLVQRALAAGIRVVTTYGMTETCGGCVYDGQPLQGVAVDLANDGRILIRSSTLFAGYRLRPDLTAEALVDGTFRTPDRGCWDAGRLVVLGRMDDIVITGGHKVDLADVEQSVQRWAARHSAHGAVLGVDDPVWGTTIIAVSDLPGSLDDLQAAVRESLPWYAIPRELIYFDRLPWLANGKPDRVGMKSMIMNVRAERQATA
jgi:o-succinylbenzoate---CoA ligase